MYGVLSLRSHRVPSFGAFYRLLPAWLRRTAAAALTAFWGWTGWLAAAWFLAMLLDYATGSAAARVTRAVHSPAFSHFWAPSAASPSISRQSRSQLRGSNAQRR